MEINNYKTICISDTHLGSKDAQAKILNNFLKFNNSDNIYLVGDIIDGWKIRQNKWKWKNTHSDVVRTLLKKAKEGKNLYWALGNHDEFLRPMLNHKLHLGKNIFIDNEFVYQDIKGKKWLVVHGDFFDGITKLAPRLTWLGDKAYDIVLSLNTKLNWLFHRLGLRYFSLSAFLKKKVKKAVDFMFQFEKNMVAYVKKRQLDGVICGHIHNAEIKDIDGITYMNDGDWVESCTALVETLEGEWKIVTWTEEHEKNISSNG